MDSIFKSWSRRGLSTLGKILIVKTFGISQLIFLMQTVELKASHYKMINNIVCKFIWNRHYLAAKAPERIKREIMCKPVKLGGFGMLDVSILNESLKIKSIGRMAISDHPFISILREKSSFGNFFYPSCSVDIEPFHNSSIEILKMRRDIAWECVLINRNRMLLESVRSLNISNILNRQGKLSLNFFRIRVMGKAKIRDLTQVDFATLQRFVETRKVELIKNALVPSNPPQGSIGLCIKIGGNFKTIAKCTSKEIRESFSVQEPIRDYKIGVTLTASEALNWGKRLNSLTATKHKNILLRVAHGDFYTKQRLQRFNLADTDSCPRCGQIEDLRHKFIECDYVKRIWDVSNQLRSKLLGAPYGNLEAVAALLGSHLNSNSAILTLNAEILLRISFLKDDQNYLLHPKKLVMSSIRTIARNEKNVALKEMFRTLLE